ncbi:MAG: site-specific DNA-methyltransferase [Hydrogenophaga sp.]|uniref:site-specific DNA-methyltransferase n=1 Tax=Hydrogenophaga sp. TaxID=1904254 RepID=UPI00257A9D99|nr:site-specific DNA-methyltransferase [Hydrogenophaga sp.]MBL0946267.1 site-specific DNA-methyltransferase [Hydrogenophaga sp.]
MEKLKMHSANLTQDNIARIRDLFPGCITEAKGKDGSVKLAVDFDQLRQELAESIVEGSQERYHLNWPGKREALLAANAPIAKTLRPCRADSVDFETTKNLFIEGDNLDALKLLQETYLGKVKMIYIDPPYNTGNDFIYEDNFAEATEEYLRRSNQKDEEGGRLTANVTSNGRFHSIWLTMIYSRLRLARNLLTDDGLIFISIDEGEASNLKLVCDEIFGPDNFVEQIAWKNKYGSGALTKGFANVHEYIFVYSKNQVSNLAAPLDDEQRSAYKLRDENFDIRGGYITQPLATNSKDDRPNLQYTIHHNGKEIRPEKQWIWSEERFLSAYRKGEIVINESNGKFSVRSKQYLRDENGVERLGKPISLLNGPFNQDGTKEIKELFDGTAIFGFPKPTKLIQYFASFVVNDSPDKDFIVLDFFSGSGSTADAVIRLNAADGGNRRFIVVQLPEDCPKESDAFKAGYETIAEVIKERIRRAGKKIAAGHPKQNVDTGFRVLKVDSSNMADIFYSPDALEKPNLDMFVDNIKPDRNSEDLLFQVMLDWGVDLALPIAKQAIQGKDVFLVDGNALAACFDGHGGVDEAFVKELAKVQPLRVVFRDAGFKDSSVKINVEQIFKLLSPATEVKCI